MDAIFALSVRSADFFLLDVSKSAIFYLYTVWNVVVFCCIVFCLTHPCSILPFYLSFAYWLYRVYFMLWILNFPWSSGLASAGIGHNPSLVHICIAQHVLSCLAAYIGYLSSFIIITFDGLFQTVAVSCSTFHLWASMSELCSFSWLASGTWDIALDSEYQTCGHMHLDGLNSNSVFIANDWRQCHTTRPWIDYSASNFDVLFD